MADAPAVWSDGQLTSYKDLRSAAEDVARQVDCIVPRGSEGRIALALPRGRDAIAGMLGVMAAGSAYVPIEADWPRRRKQLVLERTGTAAVVGSIGEGGLGLPRIAVPRVGAQVANWNPAHARQIHPAQLAYVLFTSGSTGEPKAVAMHHAALTNLVGWYAKNPYLTPGRRSLHFSVLAWDTSTAEIFAPLVTGGIVVVAPDAVRRDVYALRAFIEAHRVERVLLPPAVLAQLARAKRARPESLVEVISGGEQLYARGELARWLRERNEAFVQNHYGPTETQLATAFGGFASELPERVPLGGPIDGTSLHVLDEELRPSLASAVGELFIEGVGVARGYLGDPRQTAERFLPSPFGRGRRMYRTGDLVRRLPGTGDLEYVGRKDAQVKIRGVRVELAEVEQALRRVDGVADSAVVVEQGHGSARLAAYVSPAHLDPGDLRRALERTLPKEFVPSRIVPLGLIPRDANGKVELAALAKPLASEVQRDDALAFVCATWTRLLATVITADKDVFEVGADSLSSMYFVLDAREAGIRVDYADVERLRTPRRLVSAAQRKRAAPSKRPLATVSPLTPTQLDHLEAMHGSRLLAYAESFTLHRPDARTLEVALRSVVHAHPALALRLDLDASEDAQAVYEAPQSVPVRTHSIEHLAAVQRTISDKVTELAQELDPYGGPVLGAALFEVGGDREEAVLVLVAHRLAADMISIEILAHEVGTSYERLLRGGPSHLVPPPASHADWAHGLAQLAERTDRAVVEYWLARRPALIPLDEPIVDLSAQNLGADAAVVRRTVELPLIRRARATVRLPDLVLAALAEVVHDASGQPAPAIAVLANGRSAAVAGLDVTRSIGPFASLFPVRVAIRDDLFVTAASLRAEMGAAPHGGLSYPVVRARGPDEARAILAGPPGISYNHVGSLASIGSRQLPRIDLSARWRLESREWTRPALIEVDSERSPTQLALEWWYSPRLYHAATINTLADRHARLLEAALVAS